MSLPSPPEVGRALRLVEAGVAGPRRRRRRLDPHTGRFGNSVGIGSVVGALVPTCQATWSIAGSTGAGLVTTGPRWQQFVDQPVDRDRLRTQLSRAVAVRGSETPPASWATRVWPDSGAACRDGRTRPHTRSSGLCLLPIMCNCLTLGPGTAECGTCSPDSTWPRGSCRARRAHPRPDHRYLRRTCARATAAYWRFRSGWGDRWVPRGPPVAAARRTPLTEGYWFPRIELRSMPSSAELSAACPDDVLADRNSTGL